MAFYNLSPEERQKIITTIEKEVETDIQSNSDTNLFKYFSDEDTYIRKTAYLTIGRLYFSSPTLQQKILQTMDILFSNSDEKVRQSVVNALGEIGKKEAEKALLLYEKAMIDDHHSVRNAVRGRTHPEDVLPLLEELQDEQVKRVRDVVVHVLGQISYKKGCLEKVITALKRWKNKELVTSAITEILETHKAYEKFSTKDYKEAKAYINKHMDLRL
jgi:hypothetical protein